VPEVKTLRRKVARLAAGSQALGRALAERRVRERGRVMGGLYLDGHVRAYHGKRTIPKAYLTRSRLAVPATTDYWVNDRRGDPVFVVTADANAAMTRMLEPILTHVRTLIGPTRARHHRVQSRRVEPHTLQTTPRAGFRSPDVPQGARSTGRRAPLCLAHGQTRWAPRAVPVARQGRAVLAGDAPAAPSDPAAGWTSDAGAHQSVGPAGHRRRLSYVRTVAPPSASPAAYIGATHAPTLIFHGTADTRVPLASSQRLFQRLLDTKVPAELHTFEGAEHVFDRDPGMATACGFLADLFITRQRARGRS